jgi:hypothetical protein
MEPRSEMMLKKGLEIYHRYGFAPVPRCLSKERANPAIKSRETKKVWPYV